MTQICQLPPPLAVLLSGMAGSGKTTLGRALAKHIGAPLLDLDSVTNPLLDTLAPKLDDHWLSGPEAALIRDGRYAVLRATAADILETAGTVVMVAPFTSEIQGGRDWELLCTALAPARPIIVWLDGDPEVLAARRRARSAPRDSHRTENATPPPAVPHIHLDAGLSTAQQLKTLLQALPEPQEHGPGRRAP